MPSPIKQRTWIILDHLCRICGGRVLRCVSGQGVTAGGYPVFRCADCGVEHSGMSQSVVCWCGFTHRKNAHITPYRCLPFSVLESRPELREDFLANGFDPKIGEVGVVRRKDLQKE